ncbi:hypothetical protein DQ04_14201000 [Trypanosoma grayi]|uniref:hypothetical protein n=1 Tax=Trypanosoma grayi TaxID=71804 RepID=UPI0004F46DAD|nr:hypothetical protein DQ04_14201000 [Trypanosoma grayi]KEG06385.1 hypothetical protein DQ04_14201000 [Trypanosoma grayi]
MYAGRETCAVAQVIQRRPWCLDVLQDEMLLGEENGWTKQVGGAATSGFLHPKLFLKVEISVACVGAERSAGASVTQCLLLLLTSISLVEKERGEEKEWEALR